MHVVATHVLAGLFPGQGSQTGDLRERVERGVPELGERCIELVGEDPFARVADSTRFAQPAIFCASVAGWKELRAHVRPVALAGHSLGELSALVAAEALDPLQGLELAVRRGELMAADSPRPEGMLAVIGASEEQLDDLIAGHGVVMANDNAPGQVVLAGATDRLRRRQDVRASSACARSCWTLPGPFTRRRWPAPLSRSARRSTESSFTRPRYR